jgi:hypothetical protein
MKKRTFVISEIIIKDNNMKVGMKEHKCMENRLLRMLKE